ncbi:MAG: polysaccharide deacetylase family protein, partial [Candidatus Zixiibacteriota bacterium]
DVNWGKKFRHLTWSQIKEMSKHGFSFGSHTVNHPDLTKLEKRYVEYELKRSREELEDVLAKKVDFVSFPFGKYNRMVEELAQNIGYRKAFTICSSSNDDDSNSFVLERKGMYLFDSPLTLRIKLNGGPFFWIEDLKGRIINTFANGTTLVKKPNYDEMNFAEFKIPNQKQT